MKDNLIVYLSSRNNYEMLENEVLKNIKLDGFELINIDDGSDFEQFEYGKSLCNKNDIVFLKNKKRGVQWATQTLIDFVNENRPNCKWIVCFQHDIYPISNFFFNKLSNIIEKNDLKNIGIIGFNILDFGKYTGSSYLKFKLGFKPLGMIGMLHLSESIREKRWLSPKRQPKIIKNLLWKKPFIIEFPMWAAVAISVENWNMEIKPCEDFHFHLWLPDIAMQFNSANKMSLILPNLYCLNNQSLKVKYNIPENSAVAAKKGNNRYFGKYSPFDIWKNRWGWEYEEARDTFPKDKYNGTLLYQFYKNDIINGPLKNFNINE
jgi:hypothetical protein